MAVRVRALGHLRVLYPTGAGSGSFLHPRVEPRPDPHITGFRCGFRFSAAGAPKTQKTPERNLKTPRKEHETRKNPIETRKPPERNTFRKPDEHPNPTQNPTGLGWGVKFNPTTFFLWVGFSVNPTRI
jgi:hypothetical protein